MIHCFHFKDKQFISMFGSFEETGLIVFCRTDPIGIGNRIHVRYWVRLIVSGKMTSCTALNLEMYVEDCIRNTSQPCLRRVEEQAHPDFMIKKILGFCHRTTDFAAK